MIFEHICNIDFPKFIFISKDNKSNLFIINKISKLKN